jgi:hypothetical protein
MSETTSAPAPTALIPERLYPAADVAEYLGIKRDTLYLIPESRLRKFRVGPKGGRVRYHGRDVLQYLGVI